MKPFNHIAILALFSLVTEGHVPYRRDDLSSSTTRPGVFWREAMIHNGRPGYLNSEDAALYSVWRDVRNASFAGGVSGSGITDDSIAIQEAINCTIFQF